MAKKTSLDLNSKVSKDHLSKTQLDKKISEVAYNLYEKRNYAHGNDLADWIEAEKLVKKRNAINMK